MDSNNASHSQNKIFEGYKSKNELGIDIKSCQYVINEEI